MLRRIICEQFETFLDRATARCDGRGSERLVALTCKGRGFGPSCGGRRMVKGAAHLVDRVLLAVPIRQWVLAMPPRVRYRRRRAGT